MGRGGGGVSTDQVVERAGGASPQLDDGCVAGSKRNNRCYKAKSRNTINANNGEGYLGGLRSFDGHQSEQTHLMLAIKATKDVFSVDTIDDDSRRYDY